MIEKTLEKVEVVGSALLTFCAAVWIGWFAVSALGVRIGIGLLVCVGSGSGGLVSVVRLLIGDLDRLLDDGFRAVGLL